MNTKTLLLSLSFAALLFAQPCLAQFDESPASETNTPSANAPVDSNPQFGTARGQAQKATAKQSPFLKTDVGTFVDRRSRVYYLADPRVAPRFNSKAEAEAWVAKLCDGKHGLRDGSKPGDWRLATTTELAAAVIRDGGQYVGMDPIFAIGWTGEDSGKGFLGMADSGDRWGGSYNLNMWRDGGLDSGGFPAFIWPVRSAIANPGNEKGRSKDEFVYEPGKMVFTLNEPLLKPNGDPTFSKSLAVDKSNTMVTLTLRVNQRENYYSFELHTPAIESLDDGQIGNRSPIFGYCDDWNFHRNEQTIYASAVGLEDAIKDLQAKLNGIDGRIGVTATGSISDGPVIVTFKANQ